MAIKRNKVPTPGRQRSPIPRVVVKGNEGFTASNLVKKPKLNKVINLSTPKVHGKPVRRVLRTSIQAVKKEETTNVQNKKTWLRKTTVATANKIKRASSIDLMKNTSIAQKKIKITKR